MNKAIRSDGPRYCPWFTTNDPVMDPVPVSITRLVVNVLLEASIIGMKYIKTNGFIFPSILGYTPNKCRARDEATFRCGSRFPF
jgi:hypothetical protein